MREHFAFGSNMDPTQMATRCPSGEIAGSGQLAGYRFRINSRGVATVVPETTGLVHGIVWRLTSGDEKALDRYEGVRWGTYFKESLWVRLSAGDSRQCLVYVAKDSRPGRAKTGYLERIIEEAIRLGFPPSYVEELHSWIPTSV